MTATAPSLRTDRLVLRPYARDEVGLLHRLVGNPKVFFWVEHPVDISFTRSRFEDRYPLYESGLGWWAVFDAARYDDGHADASFAGQAILQPLPGSDEIEIGYHLVPEVWGNGYATEASRALLRHAFDTLGLDKVVAVVLPDNLRSLGVMHRLGLRHVGERVHYDLVHRYFEMTRAEHDALTGQPDDAGKKE